MIPVGFLLPMVAFAVLKASEHRSKLPVFNGGRTVSPVQVINQRNEAVLAPARHQKTVLVNFFFTHCPLICPTVVKNMQAIQQSFRGTSGLELLSVSVDPENDAPPQLLQFATRLHVDQGNWQFATGTKQNIYRLARNELNLAAARVGNDQFIHSDDIVLIDAENRIRGYYPGTDSRQIRQLIVDIKKLQYESSH